MYHRTKAFHLLTALPFLILFASLMGQPGSQKPQKELLYSIEFAPDDQASEVVLEDVVLEVFSDGSRVFSGASNLQQGQQRFLLLADPLSATYRTVLIQPAPDLAPGPGRPLRLRKARPIGRFPDWARLIGVGSRVTNGRADGPRSLSRSPPRAAARARAEPLRPAASSFPALLARVRGSCWCIPSIPC